MSCLCIGGVCIPYSALFPMLLLGLRWIASHFARYGLLPDFIARRLGLGIGGSVGKALDAGAGGSIISSGSCDAGTGCCGSDTGSNNKKKKKSDNSIATTTTTAASSSDDDDDDDNGGGNENAVVVVEHIESLKRWKEIFTVSKQSTLFVKFTADWCKPCEAIHPAYVSLASKYNKKRGGVGGGAAATSTVATTTTTTTTTSTTSTFVTLDVDGTECDILTGKMKVAMMPTFVCFRGGLECGRMTGGNDEEKLGEWVDEMMK